MGLTPLEALQYLGPRVSNVAVNVSIEAMDLEVPRFIRRYHRSTCQRMWLNSCDR